jgi:hypothetical protein
MSNHTAPMFGSTAEPTSDDHYTPAWVFEALNVTFDIDVASPLEPIPYIPAARFFTINDDGLAQTWAGRVWMNPPYSNATPWVNRFIDHGQGIALVPMAKSAWFYRLWDEATALVAIPRSRQQFAGKKSISYPVVLAAMGADNARCLRSIGRVR